MPRTKKQFEEIRESTKKEILDVSLKLFAEKGYYGTSISSIAKEAKISKGLIYNYFESKIAIVDALYANLINEFEKIMSPINEMKDPFNKLQKIIIDTIKYTVENRSYWRLYLNFILQPAPLSFEQVFTPKFFNKFFSDFAKIFKKIGVNDPKFQAYEFAAILDGMQMHLLFMEDLYPIKGMQKHILKKYSKEELLKVK